MIKCRSPLFLSFIDGDIYSNVSLETSFKDHWKHKCGKLEFYVNLKHPSLTIVKTKPNDPGNTVINEVSFLLKGDEKRKVLKEQLFESLLSIHEPTQLGKEPEIDPQAGVITFRLEKIPDYLSLFEQRSLYGPDEKGSLDKPHHYYLTFDFNTCVVSCFPDRTERDVIDFDVFWYTPFQLTTNKIESVSSSGPPKLNELKEEENKDEETESESDNEVEKKVEGKEKKVESKEKKKKEKRIPHAPQLYIEKEKSPLDSKEEKKKKEKPPSDSKEEKKTKAKNKRKASKEKSSSNPKKKQNKKDDYREALKSQFEGFKEKVQALVKGNRSYYLVAELVQLQYEVDNDSDFECSEERCKSKVACVEGGLCHTCGSIIGRFHHHTLRFYGNYFVSPNHDDEMESTLLDELELMPEALKEYFRNLGIPDDHSLLSQKGIEYALNYYSFVDCNENDHLAVIPITPQMSICKETLKGRVLKSDHYYTSSRHDKKETVFCANGICELCAPFHYIYHQKTKKEIKVDENRGSITSHAIYFRNFDRGTLLPYSEERRKLCKEACKNKDLMKSRAEPSSKVIEELMNESHKRVKKGQAKEAKKFKPSTKRSKKSKKKGK